MPHPFSVTVVETLSGARTLTQAEVDESVIWSFDPGGAGRTLTLPAEATSTGTILFISNEADGIEVLTINDDAAALVCSPTQDEAAIVFCDGVSWFGLVGSSA
jgi:hypothetical protein